MNYEIARSNMVAAQIKPWNVADANLLELFTRIKREQFVMPQYANLAFADLELPLPGGGNILAPKIEAKLLQALAVTKMDKVLEIGSGSGYVTALLANLANFVYSIEINPLNKNFALANLTRAGIKNVSLVEGDGINGLSKQAPFAKILLNGGVSELPAPLKSQLKVGGRIVAIVGSSPLMQAQVITKLSATEYQHSTLFETKVNHLIAPATNKFKF